MINIDDLVKKLNISDLTYINYIYKKYKEFMQISDLPVAYVEHNIDKDKLPAKIQILDDNIYDIVNNRYNYIFNVDKYKNTGNLASMLLDTYFENCIKNDTQIENIIYIDTNLILDDYKKLMDIHSEDARMSLSHSFETLTKNLENSSYVIWDKFSMVNSNYDKQKLYNILLTRSRRCLGNIFFIRDVEDVMSTTYDSDMYEIMNIAQIVDISRQEIVFKDKGLQGSVKW